VCGVGERRFFHSRENENERKREPLQFAALSAAPLYTSVFIGVCVFTHVVSAA